MDESFILFVFLLLLGVVIIVAIFASLQLPVKPSKPRKPSICPWCGSTHLIREDQMVKCSTCGLAPDEKPPVAPDATQPVK